MQADIKPLDRRELPSLMEPLLISENSRHRPALSDLAFELTQKSAGFRRSLPTSIVSSLATLVRSMNCYYSNLIEGHNTHPVEIERALKGDYSADRNKRDLQLEAKAHIAVQEWIDSGALSGRAFAAASIQETHRRFCEHLPQDLLHIDDPQTHERVQVIPGELRRKDVRVGQLVPISPGALPRFLARFEEVYSRLGKAETILSVAAAHHRLLWMHPFLDGNGRVARLLSHAILLETLDTGALWSVARGLARNVAQYKQLLASCDLTCGNDLVGRGTLSEESLAEFTQFFLQVCIDQVAFMENLMRPDRLRLRILRWADEESKLSGLPPKAAAVLEALLYRGELPHGDVDTLVATGERQARRIVSALMERGVLISDSPRAPLRLRFPAELAHLWMPGLFPEQPEY